MKNWKVLFVKPRTEKKVTEYCRLYGIPFYLPLRERQRIVQRRKIQVRVPIFPGYVFACFPDAQRLALLQTNLLVRILVPINARRLLRELIMVRRALRANPALKAGPPLTEGRMVRILSGTFMGIEGRVKRLAGTVRVVLNIELIGQAVTVTTDCEQIEPL